MQALKKHKIFPMILVVILVVCLIAGCSDKETTPAPKEIYESRSMIYCANPYADQNAVSSSDQKVSLRFRATIEKLLQSEEIREAISARYPDAECELSLEPVEDTAICTIVATSENPEHLADICNLAVSLLQESVPAVIPGVEIKIIDRAKQPTLCTQTE